eukprot:CAMPEP_0183557540 /NCGR_PEP_ID=MMETSP0371-20130417/85834_1 /TAXON_ID=268820 /ORGANISM="Peridinium aciculiferum, Strain PAER-2" /LENGTH=58 /DNA_ID=CAMNT_0025764571 /DNA_START=14 /DNA_END=189 /DNA_ORIENTATION=-
MSLSLNHLTPLQLGVLMPPTEAERTDAWTENKRSTSVQMTRGKVKRRVKHANTTYPRK